MRKYELETKIKNELNIVENTSIESVLNQFGIDKWGHPLNRSCLVINLDIEKNKAMSKKTSKYAPLSISWF